MYPVVETPRGALVPFKGMHIGNGIIVQQDGVTGYYDMWSILPLKSENEVVAVRECLREAAWNKKKPTFRHAPILFGCDPEIFMVDKAGNVVPATNFLGSKQKNPDVFWDGFQAEFTVSPAGCLEELQEGITSKLQRLRGLGNALCSAKFTMKSVVPIPEAIMKAAPKEAVEFGCKPSLNAYGLNGATVPDARELPWRFAGGHWHFGGTGLAQEMHVEHIKALDKTIGLLGVALAQNMDNPFRRQFYGLAGEYRLPKSQYSNLPQRIEYRTLSNFWLCHPGVMHFIGMVGRMALTLSGMGIMGGLDVDEGKVVDAICETDPKKAKKLIESRLGMYEVLLQKANVLEPTKSLKIVLGGIEQVVKDTEDVAGNWGLDSSYENRYKRTWNRCLVKG